MSSSGTYYRRRPGAPFLSRGGVLAPLSKPVLPSSLVPYVQKGNALPADVSHAALADEIFPERPEERSNRAVSSLCNRDHLCVRRNQTRRDGLQHKRRREARGTEPFRGGSCAAQSARNSCCARKCFTPPASTGRRTNRLEAAWTQRWGNLLCSCQLHFQC